MILFGSARISETGGINGAKGDQTGREVATEPFYIHSQGWNVLRAKSPTLANKLAECMIKICNNPRYGYGQGDRASGYNEAAKVGFDPSKVNVPVNIDCSEAVRLCLAYAGVQLPDIYTGNEKDVVLATGQFDLVTFTSASALYNGDILVTKTKGHTGIIVSGAKERVEPKPTPVKPTQPTSKTLCDVGIEYQAHCQTFGWLPVVKDGQVAGTQGASKRLEAIKLTMPKGTTCRLRAHLQGVGWQEYTATDKGVLVGTVGESRRVEAIEILETTGFDDKRVKVKAHCQTLGDSNFGASAGTMGFSKRIESVQFIVG